MKKDESDVHVRLAATVALYNALEFAQTNFENDAERNYVMQMICEGTIAPDAKVREASFECLVKIAAHYYAKLPAYMQVCACHRSEAQLLWVPMVFKRYPSVFVWVPCQRLLRPGKPPMLFGEEEKQRRAVAISEAEA